MVISHPIEQVLGVSPKMGSNITNSTPPSNPVAVAHQNMQNAVYQLFSSLEREYNNTLLLAEVLRRELLQEQDRRKNLEAENNTLRQHLQRILTAPLASSNPALTPRLLSAPALTLPLGSAGAINLPLGSSPLMTPPLTSAPAIAPPLVSASVESMHAASTLSSSNPGWLTTSIPASMPAVVKRPSNDPFALTPNHIKAIGMFLKEVESLTGPAVMDDRNKQLIALFDQDRVEDALLQAALGMKRHKDPIQNPAAFLNRTLTNLLQQEHQPMLMSQGFELLRPAF